MRYRRPNSSAVLETRLDYVESKLDESISSFKEAMQQMENRHQINFQQMENRYQQMENRHQESFRQMENRHQESFAELKSYIEKIISKAESSRRWSIGLVITISVAIIGFILTNGFQIQF